MFPCERNRKNHSAMVGIVQDFLLSKLVTNSKTASDVDRILQLIRKQKGTLPVKEILRLTGYSERYLERKFRSSIGITPKHFIILTRFLHACSLLKKTVSLPEVTYRCRYYDESHLINEFRKFAGITPTQFYHEENVSALDI